MGNLMKIFVESTKFVHIKLTNFFVESTELFYLIDKS